MSNIQSEKSKSVKKISERWKVFAFHPVHPRQLPAAQAVRQALLLRLLRHPLQGALFRIPLMLYVEITD